MVDGGHDQWCVSVVVCVTVQRSCSQCSICSVRGEGAGGCPAVRGEGVGGCPAVRGEGAGGGGSGESAERSRCVHQPTHACAACIMHRVHRVHVYVHMHRAPCIVHVGVSRGRAGRERRQGPPAWGSIGQRGGAPHDLRGHMHLMHMSCISHEAMTYEAMP